MVPVDSVLAFLGWMSIFCTEHCIIIMNHVCPMLQPEFHDESSGIGCQQEPQPIRWLGRKEISFDKRTVNVRHCSFRFTDSLCVLSIVL